MTTEIKNEIGQKVIVISPSQLDTIQDCFYKYYLSYEQQWTPAHTNDKLEKGSLFDGMCSLYYMMKLEQRPFEECLALALEYGRLKLPDYDVDQDTARVTIDFFKRYANYYRHEEWAPIESPQRPFAIKLYEDDKLLIILEGIIDLLVRSIRTGRIQVVDTKTHSKRVNPTPTSNQFNSYAFAMKTTEVIVNDVIFYKDKPDSECFSRKYLKYTAEQLDEWYRDTLWWVQLHKVLIETGRFPMNRRSCWSCHFREDVCEQSPSARPYLIPRSFVKKEPR